MTETIEGPVIRSVGSNPPIDEHEITRVDMSKSGLFQRIGKVFRGDERAPPIQQPAASRLSAAEELAELKPRMAHYESQYAAARASAAAGNSAPIAGGNINSQKKRLVAWLDNGLDVAAKTSVDPNFLASILDDCQGGGLIPVMRERIGFIERQQATDKLESENAQKKDRAVTRLAKATIELAAAYEAATPFFPRPLSPCLRGFPSDILRSVWQRAKHIGCKTTDDLV